MKINTIFSLLNLRSAFRATLVLLPVLGITWALGFLVVTTETETVDTIIEWLFFSFNTLQVSV